MRWSDAFIPTLRDDPAGAEAASHKLLVRAGFIRQLAAGHYSMLPLGQRTRLKVIDIVRREMNGVGGQEVVLPTLHPAEIWRQSERFDLMGENLFKLVDRRGVEALGRGGSGGGRSAEVGVGDEGDEGGAVLLACGGAGRRSSRDYDARMRRPAPDRVTPSRRPR